MTDLAHASDKLYAIHKLDSVAVQSGIRLALMDYAALAFVLASVATGPALVWLLIWTAG